MAGQDGTDTTIAFAHNKTGVVSHRGRFARWKATFRFQENQELTQHFLDALQQRYGRENKEQVARYGGLDSNRVSRKPLSGRKIRRLVSQADSIERLARSNAPKLADRLLEHPAGIGTQRVTLQSRVEQAAQRLYPQDHTVAATVNLANLTVKARDAVTRATGNGQHQVTATEAADIIARVIDREVEAVCTARMRQAVDTLSLRPGSLTWTALDAALAELNPPLSVADCPPTDHAQQVIRHRLEDAISFARVPADLLDDEGTLKSLAHEVMAGFVAERVSARAAVKALNLGEGEEAVLLTLVTRDHIPAELIEGLRQSYLHLRGDLGELTGPLPPRRVEEIVGAIRQTLQDNLARLSARVDKHHEAAMCESMLRFLLTPGGAEQAAAIHQHLAPADSLLRGIGAGAQWYRLEFMGLEAAEKTFTDTPAGSVGEPIERPVYPVESFRTAAFTDLTIRSLAGALPELAPGLQPMAPVEADAEPSDQSITALRNLGIPFPAPRRLEQDDTDLSTRNMKRATLSQAALSEMHKHLDSFIQNNCQHTDTRGIANSFTRHLRDEHRRISRQSAVSGRSRIIDQYFIDDKLQKPSPRALARKLIEFCTDQSGSPNRQMLTAVTLMAHPAVLDCIYAGCMNTDRPDLAILGGRVEGATERTNYRLSRNAHGQIRLDITESFTPFFLEPSDAEPAIPASRPQSAESPAPERVTLSPSRSILQTKVGMTFDAHSFLPTLDEPEFNYRLVQGEHGAGEGPWIVPGTS